MSVPEQPTAAESVAIVKQPRQGGVVRRLPGLHDQPVDNQAEPAAPSIAALRATFADELAQLEAEARQRGLAGAREEIAKAVAAAQQEQRRQFQAKEDALRQSLEEERKRLAALARALDERGQQLIPGLEPIVGRLALSVVLRLLGQHLLSRPLMADLAARAVEEYRLSEPLRIRIAPADHQALCANLAADARLASFEVDHDAEPGSCLIDFGLGRLDAGLDAQFAALKQALMNEAAG